MEPLGWKTYLAYRGLTCFANVFSNVTISMSICWASNKKEASYAVNFLASESVTTSVMLTAMNVKGRRLTIS